MATASGVAATTLAAVEAGRRPPTVAVLSAVLAAANLELAVDRPVQPVCRHVRRHLHDSLTVRLLRWLGGHGDLRRDRTLPLWCQLRALAATGRVELPGCAALGLWLPGIERPPLLEAGFQVHPHAHVPAVPDLRLVTLSFRPAALVIVSIASWSVEVPTPAELALDPRCASYRTALRSVARVLHEEGPVDGVGRRTAGHRDPAHHREEHEVWHTKRWKKLPMPPADDQRSWRLNDEASLTAWLRRHGYPT